MQQGAAKKSFLNKKSKLSLLGLAFLCLTSIAALGTSKEVTGPASENGRYWTCYASDASDMAFPGLEKNREDAIKAALDKCSFYSESSESCKPSIEEDCEVDDI